MIRVRTIGLWLLTALAVGGCEAEAFSGREVGADELPASGPTADGGWQSAPFPSVEQCRVSGPGDTRWLHFEGRESLEISHGLGRVPTQVLLYVAFDPTGCEGTLASGDVARIKGVDADRLVVENGSSQDFALRVALR